MNEPSARPPMKSVSTVEIAGVVAPKTSVNLRVQMTSKTNPEAPERKKHRKGIHKYSRGSADCLDMAPRSNTDRTGDLITLIKCQTKNRCRFQKSNGTRAQGRRRCAAVPVRD